MAAEREGKLVSAPASRVGDWLGVSTRRSDAVQSPQRAQKKKKRRWALVWEVARLALAQR
jgi:hypothetical protein